MPIASAVRQSIAASSWIRRMFEEGLVLKREYGEHQVFDFSLGNPDLDPPAELGRVLAELLSSRAPGRHGYMPNAGYPETRAAVAGKVAREHRVEVVAESVVMCVGAAGGLNVVLKTVVNPGDEVMVVRPYFAEYAAYAANHGGSLRVVDPRSDFQLDPSRVADGLSERTAAIILNTPNNPTGRLYPEKAIEELGECLRAYTARSGRHVYLVVDEPYRDLVYDGRVAPPIACHYADTIVVSSFSKSLSLAGERIGYIAVGPNCDDRDDLIAGLVMCNRTLGFVNAPALMQRAIARLIDAHVDITAYAQRRDRLSRALRESGIEVAKPEGAFYLFCKSPVPDDREFVLFLKQHRILVVPGTGFGYPGWFRISYAVADATVDGAIACLGAAMQAWRNRPG